MREIEFRAWDKINKQMLPHERIPVLLKNVHDNTQWAYMQFTGLKDENGKDIYEGDILSGYCNNRTKVLVVTYRASRFNCGFVASEREFDNIYVQLWYDGFEIIGNIHENPELLNG